MTKTLTIPFQLGDPVGHRGVTIVPLFRNPAVAYLTLDEALLQGTVLVAARSSLRISVSCVEQGRGRRVIGSGLELDGEGLRRSAVTGSDGAGGPSGGSRGRVGVAESFAACCYR